MRGGGEEAAVPKRGAGVLRPARADASTALFRLALVVTACALTQGAIGVATTAAPVAPPLAPTAV